MGQNLTRFSSHKTIHRWQNPYFSHVRFTETRFQSLFQQLNLFILQSGDQPVPTIRRDYLSHVVKQPALLVRSHFMTANYF